jgi:hypothetical protein
LDIFVTGKQANHLRMITPENHQPPARIGEACVSGTSPLALLLQRINDLGIPYGREDSFKMARQRLLSGRVLIGIRSEHFSGEMFLELAFELGMPRACLELLAPHLARSNAFFFGVEERADGSVCKVYLEFWDQVCQEVRRTGAQTPLLLHLGVKWDSARPGRHELARYICYPLLPLAGVLSRMAGAYPQDGSPNAGVFAMEMVRQGARRHPAANFLYLEASESGNPRCSFDVNLYKTGLQVADVADGLRQAGEHFGIASGVIEAPLLRLGPCQLGHLSGGTDRHGGEFLSVYAETVALPP